MEEKQNLTNEQLEAALSSSRSKATVFKIVTYGGNLYVCDRADPNRHHLSDPRAGGWISARQKYREDQKTAQ